MGPQIAVQKQEAFAYQLCTHSIPLKINGILQGSSEIRLYSLIPNKKESWHLKEDHMYMFPLIC